LVGANTVTVVLGLVAAARIAGEAETAARRVERAGTPEATLAIVSLV
jgi:hypothetical protein